MTTPAMTTAALQGLPFVGLPPQAVSSALPAQDAGDAALLSGEQFLQMLLGLGAGSSAGSDASPAWDALETPVTGSEKDAAGDQSSQATGEPEVSWLPIASFIASAVKAAPEADVAQEPDADAPQTPIGRQVVAASVTTPVTNADTDIATTMPVATRDVTSAINHAAEAADATDAVLTAAAAAPDADDGQPVAQGGERASVPSSLTGIQTLAAAASAVHAQDRPLAANAAAVPLQQHVGAPLRSARWAQEMSQRVALMAVSGRTSGSLSLVPEQMGPIEVRIQMNQDTANVWFGATQADTRAALQDALPRLREMFSASGLALGDAQVSQQMPRREGETPAVVRSAWGGNEEAPVSAIQPRRAVSVGLVDTYA